MRLQILSQVVDAKPNILRSGAGFLPKEKHTCYTPYATVSREWQAFFERYTFATLCLFNEDVQPFCHAIERYPDRLEKIVRIRLTIDLPEYSQIESETEEDAATVEL